MRKVLSALLLALGTVLIAQHSPAQMWAPAIYAPPPAVGSTYPLPLGSNTVTGAYSMRKLYSAYAGKAVKIERASDSAMTDIGFVGNNFDNATAVTFCTATTCYCIENYDQSGNGKNLTTVNTQLTFSADGSLASCTGNSSSSNGDSGTGAGTGNVNHSIIAVVNVISYGASYTGFGYYNGGASAAQNSTLGISSTGHLWIGGFGEAPACSLSSGTLSTATWYEVAKTYATSGTTNIGYLSNSSVATCTTITWGLSPGDMGMFSHYSGGGYSNAYVPEMVFFSNTVSPTDLTTYYNNAKAYWSTL